MPADTNPDAVKLLSDDEVAEIEARANAATPRYCVDWEKGRHALLQDSGWRSASEEQPRTIATFDRENGYLDLLFCAEARTDIPALCATVRALREKHTQLAEVSGEWARLLDRIRLWSKCEDGYPLDEHVNNLTTQNTALREQLAQLESEHTELTGIVTTHGDTIVKQQARVDELQSQLAQVTQERDEYRERLLKATETEVEI